MSFSKLYLHNATTAVGGTLPGVSTLSVVTPTKTVTGADTNRAMTTSIGTAQTSAANSTNATTTTQSAWFRRFVSPELGAQSLAGIAWTVSIAYSQSNTNSLFAPTYGLWVWRPGTGALVSKILDVGEQPDTFTTPGSTSEIADSTTNNNGQSVTAQDGDILVLEIWRRGGAQSMATTYTNTFFYDGTTEASTTSNAGFLSADRPVLVSGESAGSGDATFPYPGAGYYGAFREYAERARKRFWRVGWERRPTGVLVMS